MNPLRIAWTTFVAVPLFLLMLALFGCAATGPPPAATAIPYSPTLITLNRAELADRWAADIARRKFVETYLNALCAADGPWATMNGKWITEEAETWRGLWRFEPIPQQPASMGGGGSSDIGAIIGSVLGGLVKGGLMGVATTKSPLPPGLPPC